MEYNIILVLEIHTSGKIKNNILIYMIGNIYTI